MAEVKTIQAGELNKRIQIISVTADQDEDGFYSRVREELVHGCWAKVSFTSGTEIVKANADFGEVKARFLIRYPRVSIDWDMFVRYGGREYEITYINDYAGRKYLEIWGTWQDKEAPSVAFGDSSPGGGAE